MEEKRKIGFAPVFDEHSRVLILGSFPSVKSRQIEFYYGNKQNRFWRTICGYFGEEIPETVEGKKDFLSRRQIALWDMVVSCEIEGSADASVKNAEVADLNEVLRHAKIDKILLNGTLAYELFVRNYRDLAARDRMEPGFWWPISSNTALKSSVNRLGCPAVLPCLIQNQLSKNCEAPQSEDFSIDFGKGGRRRIEHTTSTHLTKDAEKTALRLVCFILGWYSTNLLRKLHKKYKKLRKRD